MSLHPSRPCRHCVKRQEKIDELYTILAEVGVAYAEELKRIAEFKARIKDLEELERAFWNPSDP